MSLDFKKISGISPLSEINQGFLQVILPQFSLVKKGEGTELNFELRENYYCLRNSNQKLELHRIIQNHESSCKSKIVDNL
jgi:hypothetical protein